MPPNILVDGVMREMTAEEVTEYTADVANNIALEGAQEKANAIAVIDARLAAIDIKRVRPLAEGDADYLATLTAQAVALRAQRKALA